MELLKRIGRWIIKLTPARISFLIMIIFLYAYVQTEKKNMEWLRLIEVKAYDLRFQALNSLGNLTINKKKPFAKYFLQDISDKIVIADIDNRTLEHFGWPFPREKWAQFMRQMQKYEPKVVGFDVVFDTPFRGFDWVKPIVAEYDSLGLYNTPKGAVPAKYRRFIENSAKFNEFLKAKEREADQDSLFAAELGKMNNVVTGYFGYDNDYEVTDISTEDAIESARRIHESTLSVIAQGGENWDLVLKKLWRVRFYGLRPPIASLADQSENFGFFTARIDSIDGTIRQAQMVAIQKVDPSNPDEIPVLYPSLSLSSLWAWYGRDSKPNVVINSRGYVERIYMRPTEATEDLEIATDEYGRLLVNWLGEYGETFHYIPMYDILTDFKNQEEGKEIKNPRAALKGKIVMVASSATAAHDLRTSPFGTVPGIEMHATVISNILEGNILLRKDEFRIFDMLFILLVGILFGILLPRVSAVWGGIVALGFLLAYLAFNVYLFLVPHYSFTIVFPLAEILFIYTAVTVYRYATEEREKRFIKQSFQYYLSPAVIDQLMDDPSRLALGGERKEMTAFFSDIQSFSSFSEKMEPEQLVAFLNIYLTEMCDIVLRFDGTIDKFEGDAIIAFFGAPIDLPDHAARACLCSAEIQSRMIDLRKEWGEGDEGWPEVHMRIGLNTGPMVVGNMGSRDRMDYTMMGDNVNLAARLEEAAKQYKIYSMISEFTVNEAGDVVELRELDSIRVVGKEKPVVVYEIMGKKGEVDPEKMKVIETFHEGLALYRKKDFDQARQKFEAALKLDPADGPSIVFSARCEEFAENPPGDGWDGVYTLTKK